MDAPGCVYTYLVGHFDGIEEAFEAFPFASWEVVVALAASPDEIAIHLTCPPDDVDSYLEDVLGLCYMKYHHFEVEEGAVFDLKRSCCRLDQLLGVLVPYSLVALL